VRQAIGAPKINLMGVSYGTRVAQQYAMRYPQHTRTIVLDSVAPNAITSATTSRATSNPRSTCSSASCARRRVARRRSAIRATPQCVDGEAARRIAAGEVSRRERRGEMKEERLRPAHVAGLARMYAYAPLASSILPLLLNEADQAVTRT
jgi:pimeloyl-ACP methyl ester carboxylesterase